MRRDVAYEREPNLKILPTERRREIERQTAVNHVWTVTAAQLIRAGRARHNPESSLPKSRRERFVWVSGVYC